MRQGRFSQKQSLWLFGLASAVLILAHLVFGLPSGSSTLYNVDWYTGFSQAFWSGDLYPRFLPDFWHGFGGYDFYFYFPLPFWFASTVGLASCPSCSSETVLSVSGAWMMILSGIAFFAFARRWFEPHWAGIGSLIYAVLPYNYLVNWVARQAIGEVAAHIFLPLVALATIKMIEDRKGGPLLAISFAAMVLSHLPVSLITAHAIAAIVLWTVFSQKLSVKDGLLLTGRFAIWGGLGLFLTAFYWIPAVGFLSLVSPENLYAAEHFTATNWLYLDFRAEPSEKTSLTAKWGLLLAVLAASAAWLMLRRQPERTVLRDWIIVPTLLTAFFLSVLSFLVWEYWIINMVQFPLRFLFLTDLSIALATTLTFRQAMQAGWTSLPDRTQMLVRVSAAVALAMSVSAILQAWHAADLNVGLSASVPGTGPTEYLSDPLFRSNMQRWSEAVEPDMDAPTSNALFYSEMIRGKALADAALQKDAPGANFLALPGARYALTFETSESRRIRVPIAAWPYWTAETARGQALTVSQDEALGILSVDVPAGAQRIEFRLAPSPWEVAGMWMSLLSLLIWICVVIAGRFRSLPQSQPA